MQFNPQNQGNIPNRPNPNDPRFLSHNHPQNFDQGVPPQYLQVNMGNHPQNNLRSPFILDQSLPSTSSNNANMNYPSNYNNEQYILDMDKLYSGLEQPIQPIENLNPGSNRVGRQFRPEDTSKQTQNVENENDTILEIVNDINETKTDPKNLKPQETPQNNYRPINGSHPNPNQRPQQQRRLPSHSNNPQRLQYPSRPVNNRRTQNRSEKMINRSVLNHCRTYRLNKKKPIFFVCNRCKVKTKSIVKQE